MQTNDYVHEVPWRYCLAKRGPYDYAKHIIFNLFVLVVFSYFSIPDDLYVASACSVGVTME